MLSNTKIASGKMNALLKNNIQWYFLHFLLDEMAQIEKRKPSPHFSVISTMAAHWFFAKNFYTIILCSVGSMCRDFLRSVYVYFLLESLVFKGIFLSV